MMKKNKNLIFIFLVAVILVCSLIVVYFIPQLKNKSSAEVVLLGQQTNQDKLFLNLQKEILTENAFSKSSNGKIELISDEKNSLDINSVEDESDAIFKRAGEEYILREGEEYKLGIDFFQSLPSKICVGSKASEYVDITLVGEVLIEFDYRWKCEFPGGDNYKIKIRLMEADTLSGDDLINEITLDINRYCTNLNFNVPFSYTFKGIDLGKQFGGAEDTGTIEVYATVEPLDKKTGKYSTKNYDVDKDSNCECMQGDCCDSGSHKFKSSGSQPTGKSDEYYCSGTSSATGTNYVKQTDYYCNGKSSISYSKEVTKDTCGSCEYCEKGYSSCQNYDSSTSCGSNKHCDGRGSCISCANHASSTCYGGDVYWYNSCGNREDKKTECGENTCDTKQYFYSYYCKGNDLWQEANCRDRGCSGSSCYNNEKIVDNKRSMTCQFGCENGDCKEGTIVCSAKNHCMKTGYSGNAFCLDGNVYRAQIIDYNCINPGKANSYCDYETKSFVIENCKGAGCSNGVCAIPTPVEEFPDLIVSDVVIQNVIGNEVVLGFTIKNIGGESADFVYWMVDTGSSDENPKREVPVSLLPGGFTRAFIILNYSQSGNYRATVIADFENVIEEFDETNNEKDIFVMV